MIRNHDGRKYYVSYHGFQLGGRGATIPSLAIHSNSFSFTGSIPIASAYSKISINKIENSFKNRQLF